MILAFALGFQWLKQQNKHDSRKTVVHCHLFYSVRGVFITNLNIKPQTLPLMIRIKYWLKAAKNVFNIFSMVHWAQGVYVQCVMM